MFGKCWSIQYVNHEAYKLCDKIHTQPMYFTTKAAMKAIHDWIAEMNAYGTTTIDHITEEFLANTEPGYYDEIYMSNDACFSIVVVCHRIA
jgi:hypothetical protein